jgi:hypothetical protein
MKIKKTVHIILFIFFIISELNAQDFKVVTGRVTSFKTIQLNNVKVTSEKSGEVVFTDSLGRYSIKCADKDILRAFASGFNEEKNKVGKGSVYDIDLVYTDNVKNFNDAVSHGHISAASLKDAIFKEESKNTKDYSNYKSIYELIASEIYEVRVNGTEILNKKVKSFDSTPEVLLVVDEKIVRDISFINPNYVKSVEFVEDVGATMYGSMAANGVLKITLK